MKVIYFAEEAWEEQYVRGKYPEGDLTFVVGPVQDSDVTDDEAEVLSVFVNSKVTASVMERFPKLRLIATRSTGFDHIDITEAKTRGITVATVPTYGANTVAEYAFALLLALSRRVSAAHAQVAQQGSFSQDGLRGFDLEGKTIGVVGSGHIGVHAIKIAKGFGMKVVVYDAFQNADVAREFDFTYVPLEQLLAESDVITIHVPYNKDTHHLINADTIARMKKNVYLINTARGAVVDTKALVAALEKGQFGGVGLDVLEDEGDTFDESKLLLAEHPQEEALKDVLENQYLMHHPRVIVTPHIAFDTTEAIERILDTTLENIVAFEHGEAKNVLAA